MAAACRGRQVKTDVGGHGGRGGQIEDRRGTGRRHTGRGKGVDGGGRQGPAGGSDDLPLAEDDRAARDLGGADTKAGEAGVDRRIERECLLVGSGGEHAGEYRRERLAVERQGNIEGTELVSRIAIEG